MATGMDHTFFVRVRRHIALEKERNKKKRLKYIYNVCVLDDMDVLSENKERRERDKGKRKNTFFSIAADRLGENKRKKKKKVV